ncbi:unnamed protein product [Periconia digitata]|uniref:Uncharacterized protein n=1 Tax=Periconia digitata TaxID=1303443 RepID=A0A9W4XSC2_9PLEO|nr:unnamed protein product [Periconia digitata]
MNFSPYFSETRLRCYIAFNNKLQRKESLFQMAYVFACLEHQKFPSFYDPKYPCRTRELFVKALVDNPREFKVYSRTTTQTLLQKTSFQMGEWRRMNWNSLTRTLFPSEDHATGAPAELPEAPSTGFDHEIKPKPKPKKRGARGKKKKAAVDEDAMDVDPPAAFTDANASTSLDNPVPSKKPFRTTSVVLDGRRLSPLRKERPILDKLMMKYPAYHLLGEIDQASDDLGEETRLAHPVEQGTADLDDLSGLMDLAKMQEEDVMGFLYNDWFLISKNFYD